MVLLPLESELDREPLVPLLLAKNSKSGLLLTVARSDGLKRPDRLDMSALSCLGLCETDFPDSVVTEFTDWVRPFCCRRPGELKLLGELRLGDLCCCGTACCCCGGPGRRPNVGNSNEKLTSFGLLTPPPRPLPARYEGRPLALSDELLVPLSENCLRYSDSSDDIFSICARKMLFSWFADSDAFSKSSTLVSRSLRCFSLRSRNARWAARFCAFRFCSLG